MPERASERAALVLKVAAAHGGSSCHYCGLPLVHGTVTLDHVVPVSAWLVPRPRRGAWRDLVLACRPCNLAKAASWPECSCAVCMGAVGRWLLAHAELRRSWLEAGDGQVACRPRGSAPAAPAVPAPRPESVAV